MKRIILATAAWFIVSIVLQGGITSPAQAALPQTAPTGLTQGWTRTWGGNSDDNAANVAVDRWGNLYVSGSFAGTVNFDPRGANPAATFTSSNGTADAFLSKFSPDGTFQWARTWGGSVKVGSSYFGRDGASGVGVDGLGSVYVTGSFQYTVDFNPDPGISENHTSNSGSQNNIYLSKFSPDGTFQWVKTWGPADAGGEGYSLAVDGANAVYVVGDFSGSTTNFNPWDAQHPDQHINHPPINQGDPLLFDAFLSKFDADGNFIWAKTWGGEGYDDGPGVAVDGAGGVYVAGMYASTVINFDPAGGSGGANHPAHDSGIKVDVFLSKFDSSGSFQWVRTWGGQGKDDIAISAAVDGAGSIYVGGRFECTNCDFNPGGTADIHSSNGLMDAFVSKFDSSGTFQWARTWGGPGDDATGGLAVDGWGNVYATGQYSGTVNFAQGSGIDNHASLGLHDVFAAEFAANKAFLGMKSWGGSGEDYGYRIAYSGAGRLEVVGSFSATVDFNPGGTADNHTANGMADALLTRFSSVNLSHGVYIPLVTR